MFGRLPLRHIDPDEAIGLGAAVAAGMKARNQALEEIILTDICPHTLGVNTSQNLGDGQIKTGIFDPIIQRNSTVPVSRVKRYHPINDWQKEVRFSIYQGESPRVENNVKLGEITVSVPPKLSNDNPVDVRFTYDINGLLQVEASVLATGQTHELILEQNPGLLSQEEIRARFAALEKLKIHPREQQENLNLIARAERLYEELLWARPQLQDALLRFQAALDAQEESTIAEHRKQFCAMLDQIEARS
jgi:molecular chaperone HscC